MVSKLRDRIDTLEKARPSSVLIWVESTVWPGGQQPAIIGAQSSCGDDWHLKRRKGEDIEAFEERVKEHALAERGDSPCVGISFEYDEEEGAKLSAIASAAGEQVWRSQ